jgi:uncharacterized protein (TIGR01777 family)
MRVLIAGATGLIGKPLVAALLERGDEVLYLTTSRDKTRSIAGAQGFYWDPKNHFCPKEALENVTVVINLAGASVASPWTKKHKTQILQSRLDSAKALKLAMKNYDTPLHYIGASGISGYASSYSLNYNDQDQIFGSGFLAEVVRQWETATHKGHRKNVTTTAVRTGLVLAREGGVLPQIIRPIKWGVGAVLGSGKQHQSWIHIDDLVGVYLWIIDKKLSGNINAVAPEPVTQEKMTQVLAQHLRSPLWLPAVPAFVLRTFLGERSALVLDSQWVIPEVLTRAKFAFKFSNLRHAVTDLLSK